MMTISIVPYGDCYVVRTFWDKGYLTLGYIRFEPGSEPWVVTDRHHATITRHAMMRDARAAAKTWFGNPQRGTL